MAITCSPLTHGNACAESPSPFPTALVRLKPVLRKRQQVFRMMIWWEESRNEMIWKSRPSLDHRGSRLHERGTKITGTGF